MGKYMKKLNSPGEVAVKDVSQSSFGVRTRAKTLASRLLQSSVANTPSKSGHGYLELRSRRLVKRSPLLRKYMQSSQIGSFANNGFTGGENEGLESESVYRKACSDSGLKSNTVGPGKREDACLVRENRGLETRDLGTEVSIGENNLESEDRSYRESKPCNLIKVADNSSIPGSTIKQTSLAHATNQSAQSACFIYMPTTDEVEEFFVHEEQLCQRLFVEKYNFDVVNDLPLPGRYEWVKKSP